jgi:oligopeptide transport system substrate-binding protein
MISFKKVFPLVALTAVALAPAGSARAAIMGGDGLTVLSSPMRQATEPITNYAADATPVVTFDPQAASDATSIPPIENLFLGLTDLDPKTTAVRAELATSWEVDETGTVWTFTLRDDVPWVRFDPATGETTEVRKVTAQDVEFGMKRACDPRLNGYYGSVAGGMIKGCTEAFTAAAEGFDESLLDAIGVKALSDTQLEVTLKAKLGYFLSASGMWMFRPVPRETIEEFSDKWTEVGNIVTNGPFVISKYEASVEAEYLKNPLYPNVNDNYGGNVERRVVTYVQDGGTVYSLYQNNQVDSAGAPRAELERIRQDPELSKELRQSTDLAVFYFGFAFDKAPFDNVHVRRAFSAAFDRQTFVTENLDGRGQAMAHFMPPGIRGAVPINEVGIGQPDTPGFSADFAKAELEKGGFANCEGFPEINIIVFQGAADWGEFLQNSISTTLGCDASKITIEEVEFSALLQVIRKDTAVEQRPHMWTLGWGPDYPDAHNWVHDVLSCNAENPFQRECSDIDKLIDDAASEQDPDKRNDMYRQIEEGFFGEEGLFPIMPLYLRVIFSLAKPWYTAFFDTDGLFGGPHWESRQIDQAAQLAARGQ